MAKKRELVAGDRIRIARLRDEGEEQLPADIVGQTGIVSWITQGFAGDKSVFEIRLDDGRVVNLYATEIEPAD